MSIEKGKAYLSRFGIEDRVREFDVSSATVELAAQALGVKGQRIAKSLSFKVGDEAILVHIFDYTFLVIVKCSQNDFRIIANR